MAEIRVLVKALVKGTEDVFTVRNDAPVSELKSSICRKLGHPEVSQKLLNSGTVLLDHQTLKECKVVDGSKLHLVLKKRATEETPKSQATKAFIQELKLFLRPHFVESDSRAIVEKIIASVDKSISEMNLDDIERYAADILAKETTVNS